MVNWAACLLKDLIVISKEVVKELKATREGHGDEIRATGLMLAGKIDGVRQEMVGEIRGLRCVLQGDLKERRKRD